MFQKPTQSHFSRFCLTVNCFMFKRRRGITISNLPKYLAKGYGQGEGANYQPMIHVQDFPSRGWRYREYSWKTGRQHDYLSSPELKYHYIFDWPEAVLDIREQFPLLPIEHTIEIAEMCGIRHPSDRATKEPVVMTTDFLIKLQQPIGSIEKAITIKPAKDLNKRTVEKFEIERRFYQAKGIHWVIGTENEIDEVLVENIKWVHKFQDVSSLAPIMDKDVRYIGIKLTRMVIDGKASLNELALKCDKQLGLEMGQSLVIARHLIASRQWLVDMTKPIHPYESLNLRGSSLVEIKQKKRRSR